MGQGHGGGGTASPSDLQRRRHPPESSRTDRSRSASPCHHHQCLRENRQAARSTSAEADGGGEPGRGDRVQADIRPWAPGAERPPAEAAEPRLKTGCRSLRDPIPSTQLQRGPSWSVVWAPVSQTLVTRALFTPNK